MKKLFFIAAIASAALVSCTKNEVAPAVTAQHEITFVAPVVAPNTKAPQTGELPAIYNGDEQFKVQAWYQADEVSTTFNPDADTHVYMDGSSASPLCVKFRDADMDASAGVGAWHPFSNVYGFVKYYWPKNGKLTFSAYSPAEATGTATFDVKKGLKIENFSVDSDVTKQYDLLYSNRVFDRKNSAGTNASYDGVDIVFNHALTSVHVKVATDASYDSETITVNNMYIENVFCTANFVENLSAGTETTSVPSAKWEGWYDERTITIGSTNYPVTTTSTQYGTTALLIPQEFNHGASKVVTLVVNYTIKNGDGTTLPQVAKFALNSTGNAEWLKGYRFTYNLTFGVNEIYFAPAVEAWTNYGVTFPQI